MKTIAYLRVSTDKQDLDNQKLEIEKYARSRNLVIDQWIQVTISSRKNGQDRRIDELLSKLKRGDCLIVSEISRLARSIREIHQIMHRLSKKKIECHFIKQNLITHGDNDMATKIYLNAFALASEIERDLISQRTKNGLALAKKRGKKLGNPNLPKINKRTKEAADKYADTLRAILTGFVDQGLTYQQMADALRDAGVKTRRGSTQWSTGSVQGLLKRLDLRTKRARR